jgi:hypothetical protein
MAPVTHGVNRALKAHAVGTAEETVQFLLLPVEDAAVLAVGGVGLSGGGGGTARRAVGHHLEGTDLQALVTQAGVDAGPEQPQQRMGEAVHRGEGVDPKLDQARRDHVLAGRKGRAHESARVVHAGGAGGQVRARGAGERLTELVGRRRRRDLQRSLRRLVRHAEVLPAVPVVPSTGRVGRGVVDAAARQRQGVHGRDVPARPREDHWVIGRHRVPVETVRVALLGQA